MLVYSIQMCLCYTYLISIELRVNKSISENMKSMKNMKSIWRLRRLQTGEVKEKERSVKPCLCYNRFTPVH